MTQQPQTGSDAPNEGPEAVPRLVERLRKLAESNDDITIDLLMRRIGTQGHAPLLLILSLLMVLPTGMIPGLGGALGTLVALIGLQMLIRHQSVWLPEFLGKRSMDAEHVRRLAKRIEPGAHWLRRQLRIRLVFLAEGRASLILIALILMIGGGSLLVLGAVPVAVPLVGLPIAFLAFGLLSRDGALIVIGYALAAAVPVVLLMLLR